MTVFEIISGIIALITTPVFILIILRIYKRNMKNLEERREERKHEHTILEKKIKLHHLQKTEG